VLTFSISDIVRDLQVRGALPGGDFEYTAWEQLFSFIYRVSIGGQVFFFKKLKPRRGSSNQDIEKRLLLEYEALKRYSCLFNGEKHFNIPKVVYFSVEDLLLVTNGLNGISIMDVARNYASRKTDNESKAIDVYVRTGKFLKVLHESESYPYTIKDLEELINYIRRRLISGIFNKSEEESISSYLTQSESIISLDISKHSKNPTHHDFNPDNILSQEEDINVLDFGDFRIGHRFQDLVYFKLMLDIQLNNWVKYRQSAASELLRAFSQGYGCDYNIISKDALYNLYVLKNYAIFITTFAYRRKCQTHFQLSFGFIKDKILNFVEFYRTKRKILSKV
jgi:serine/threonine protein kinase